MLRECLGGSIVRMVVIKLLLEDGVDHVHTAMTTECRAPLRSKMLDATQSVALRYQIRLGVGMNLTIEG